MNDILLVDIGGTNIRYASLSEDNPVINDIKKINIEAGLGKAKNLLNELFKKTSAKNVIVSAAGPKIEESIRMTKRDILIDSREIRKKFKFKNFFLLNDWEAIGYSLSSINKKDINLIKPGKSFNKNTFFIGPGTGLGAALLVDNEKVIPTEIGNTTTLTKALLKNYYIDNDDQFRTLEDVLSGTAISNIYEFKSGIRIKSEEVLDLYKKDDDLAKIVINGFIKSLAETLSDMALTYFSGNGIYIAGGLIRSILEVIDKQQFIQYFYGDKKLIHLDILEMTSIGVINKPHACIHGNLNFYMRFLNKEV